ncbi:hypothetical protein COU76_03505 [Candidatus Peregrinibacteria bacterium CG10_big_fil_rev_8_21_14_0_10_49_10]|nr:MAG: hypothetical protein COU76_03505 [Candidatus Peregrinibacteria bacterium CG10_big_fil_rev_8_21_14_0_10_49_10]
MSVNDRVIAFLEAADQAGAGAHQCRLHHDEAYVTLAELRIYIDMSMNLQRDDHGLLRPLCKQLPGNRVSIGCAHDDRYRKAMITVLSALASETSNWQRCSELIAEIRDIAHQINNDGPDCLDRRMVLSRSIRSAEGAETRRKIGDQHSLLVERLLAINRETLHLYREAVSRQVTSMEPSWNDGV